jgi:transcriptional regulator with XRE-family HTH domain
VKSNPKKYYLIVTELLYRLRTNAGITQKQLSEKLNVPQSYVSKIETGERRIDIIELRELCVALDSSVVEFTVMLEKEINET